MHFRAQPQACYLPPHRGVYVTAETVESDYTFGATPPSQLGNADTALRSLLDTYAANSSSPYYLSSSSDISSASSSGGGPVSMQVLLATALPASIKGCTAH